MTGYEKSPDYGGGGRGPFSAIVVAVILAAGVGLVAWLALGR